MNMLPTITASQKKTVYRCPRENLFAYVMARRPVATSEALEFGTLSHSWLEAYFLRLKGGGGDPLDDALKAIDASAAACSPFDRAKARAMARAYYLRWGAEDAERWEVLGAEVRFGPVPLRDHETSGEGPWLIMDGDRLRPVIIDGKIDAVVRDRRTGDVSVFEHKTAGEDVTAGSAYWRRLRMDAQASMYYDGAAALGYPRIAGVIYDLLKKPRSAPLRATPEAARKWTKPTAKEPSRLYSGMRDRDETPAEYEARCLEEIAESPNQWLCRGIVVRLRSEILEARRETAHAAKVDASARRGEWQPRNPEACHHHGRFCSYFDVCCGEADINNEALFKQTSGHPELDGCPENTRVPAIGP